MTPIEDIEERSTVLYRLGVWWRSSRLAQLVTFMLFDAGIVWAATFLAYYLRFDGVVPPEFSEHVVAVATGATIVMLVVFWMLQLYHFVWKYVGLEMVLRLALASAVLLVALVDVDLLIPRDHGLRFAPVGTLFILVLLVFVGAAGLRSLGRLAVYLAAGAGGGRRHVIIIGAGDAGSLLLRDIENQPDLGMRVVGFVDDDASMRRRMLRSVPVLGMIEELPELVESNGVDEVFVALPSASLEERRRVFEICSRAGIMTRVVRSMIASQIGVADLRKVSVEDLLGREPVRIDVAGIRKTIGGKTVLVTGAAGSIGSELCRQVMAMSPRRIVLVDIDESRLYEMFLELHDLDPDVPKMRICDIRDRRKLNEICVNEAPHLVLHAAAYKHVPLMELEPDEAVKSNVQGTRNVAMACELADVKHLVMISTDKAVQPQSVMGLTKAIAERIVLDASRRGLRVTVVRFGNVLGSRGSVVPLFEEQLRRGGPIRVTHPDVTRYFMTIPEAARLVLQAQAISDGGEIFVLEMGEPVRIVDLAQKMIVLSGVDTTIEFTGLRPAEKLHEVLVTGSEELIPTACDKVLRVDCVPWVRPVFTLGVEALVTAARFDDEAAMRKAVEELVPTFAGQWLSAGGGASVVAAAAVDQLDPEMETLF